MNCEHITLLMEAFVLDALPPDEHEAVVAHLALCDACRMRLQKVEPIAAALIEQVPVLLHSAGASAPPARLKQRLLTAIRAETAPLAVPDERQAIAPAPNPMPIISPKPRFTRSYLFRLGAAVLIGTAALLAVWSVSATVALQNERITASTLTYRLDQQAIVLEVVGSPSTTRLIMRSPDIKSSSYGKVFERPDLPYVVVMVDQLTPPPPEFAYFLWGEVGDTRIRLGTIEVNAEGFGMLIIELTGNKETFDKIFLTLQPVSLSQPSDEMILGTQFRPGRQSTPMPVNYSPF